MQDEAFTLDEFLFLYKIGRTKAFEEIKEGRLVVAKVGTRILISRKRADEWLASLEKPARKAA